MRKLSFSFSFQIKLDGKLRERFTVNVVHGKVLQQGLQSVTLPLGKALLSSSVVPDLNTSVSIIHISNSSNTSLKHLSFLKFKIDFSPLIQILITLKHLLFLKDKKSKPYWQYKALGIQNEEGESKNNLRK